MDMTLIGITLFRATDIDVHIQGGGGEIKQAVSILRIWFYGVQIFFYLTIIVMAIGYG